MIAPIIGSIALVGGGTVCWRGVTAESGMANGRKWRVRFACWRWIAQIETPNGDMKTIGAFGLSKRGDAKAAAIMAAAAQGPARRAVRSDTVKIVKGTRVG